MLIRPLSSVVVLSALALQLAGCTSENATAAPAQPQKESFPLITVSDRPVPRYLTVTGDLNAFETSRVAADGMGKVIQTFVERGAYVSAGAPLVQLDSRNARFVADEANAMAEAARVQKSLAELECDRAEKLRAAEAINQAEYDRMVAGCGANKWSSEAAEARKATANKILADAIVRAPFAGMIVERHVSVGEYVRPDAAIATVVQIDPLRLELTIPEAQAGAIGAELEVEFEVIAFPGEKFHGMTKYVGPTVRAHSRDVVVEAIVLNKDRRLRPGMFAVARIAVGETTTPVIPKVALKEANGSHRVFKVANGKLEERIVQLGDSYGEEVAVLSGIAGGDRIVAQPSTKTIDGISVE